MALASGEEQSCPSSTSSSASNPLRTRLLELWSVGRLSATQVAEIGHLATLEGCKSADIVKLASCGNFGQQKGNAHRDLT